MGENINDMLYNMIMKDGIKSAVDLIIEQSDTILLLSNQLDRMNDRMIMVEQELSTLRGQYQNHIHYENSKPI